MENDNFYSLKNLTALVVEDDVVSRALIGEILKKFKMNISYARNGLEAVEMVTSNSDFDFILMDLNLPIMNGFEATQKIRAIGYTKPIIAQTAYATNDDMIKIHAAAFDAYIAKPISGKNFLSTIEKCMK